MEFNPVGLDGLEFIEFCGPDKAHLDSVIRKLGFTKIGEHKSLDIALYRQGDTNFILNNDAQSFAGQFRSLHGASVCSTGFRVKDANEAFKISVERGARPVADDQKLKSKRSLPAIYGIGDSIVYFVDQYQTKNIYDSDYNYVAKDIHPIGFGMTVIDHMTNNVPKGEMQKWCDFYEKVFNFKEKRYFDIKGKSTGLISKVMKSPCGKFSIPINEPSDSKSQIQEYLDEYKGSGIQHIALLTDHICDSVKKIIDSGIEFLAAPPQTYYDAVPNRVPFIKEDRATLQKLGILADGDQEGYLLQIFTKNQVGPVFIEVIQRRNHFGFGDGNFQALFDAMEADQRARGVL